MSSRNINNYWAAPNAVSLLLALTLFIFRDNRHTCHCLPSARSQSLKHKSHASFPQFSEHSGAYQYASFTVKFCRAIKAGRSLGRSLAISRGSDEMTEAVQTAKNILKSLDDRISSDAAGRTDEELDLKHFTHEMSVLAQLSLNKNRKKMSQTAPIAQDILEKMEKLYLSKSTSFELDNIAYNAVANAWSKSGRKDAGLKIEKLLEHMEELSNDGFAKVKPCTITYNTAISAWASSGEDYAISHAEKLLAKMIDQYNAGDHGVKPDTFTYSSLIDVYSSLSSTRVTGLAKRAEGVLTKMEDLYMAGEKDVKPNIYTFCAVIDSWNKSGEIGSAHKAEAILGRTIKFFEAGDEDFRPNVVIFSAVISSWARSNEKEATKKIEMLLRRMQNYGIRPNVFTYSSMISAYAKAGNAKKAEDLLNEMEKRYLAGDKEVRPNVFTYSSIIHALAMSGKKGSAEKAEALLKRMEDLYEAGDDNLQPNVIVFSSVLHAYRKSGLKVAPKKMEDILNYMEELHAAGNKSVKPTVVIYNQILDALAQSKYWDGGDKAEVLIERMTEKNIPLNSGHFKAAIVSHLKSGKAKSAQRAEALLRRAETLYNGGNKNVKPELICYNACISAWARSKEPGAAKKAESILDAMIADGIVIPGKVTFNTVSDAWAKSRTRGAGKQAEQVLMRLTELYESSGNEEMKPDIVSYSTVIDAYAKNEKPLEAERILKKMTSVGVKPDAVCYNSLMTAWAFSKERGKAKQAKRILDMMSDQFESGNKAVKPKTIAYNIVLNACAKTAKSDRVDISEAIQTAFGTYSELQNSRTAKSNEYIYGTLLQVLRDLMPLGHQRCDLVKKVFLKCRHEGYVNVKVLKILSGAAASAELFDELVERSGKGESGNVKLSDLPSEWTRNVRKRR